MKESDEIERRMINASAARPFRACFGLSLSNDKVRHYKHKLCAWPPRSPNAFGDLTAIAEETCMHASYSHLPTRHPRPK